MNQVQSKAFSELFEPLNKGELVTPNCYFMGDDCKIDSYDDAIGDFVSEFGSEDLRASGPGWYKRKERFQDFEILQIGDKILPTDLCFGLTISIADLPAHFAIHFSVITEETFFTVIRPQVKS